MLVSVVEEGGGTEGIAVVVGELVALTVRVSRLRAAVDEMAAVKAVSVACLTTTRAASTTTGLRNAIVPESL